MEGNNSIRPEDYENAKALCAQHLGDEWKDPKSIHARLLSGGFLNLMFLCTNEAHPAIDENGNEVKNQIIVRLITNKFPAECAGEAAEAIAMDIIARAGLGPKLLGVFPGGRLEEFLPSRMLNHLDAQDPNTLAAVAKVTARMHSLNVPIKRDPNVWASNIRKFVVDVLENYKTKDFSIFSVKVQHQLKAIIGRDLLGDLDWIHETMKKIKTRVVFGRLDHYANNILLKDSHGEIVTEDDIAIIDMDVNAYFYRGADIGCYLYESGFDYSDTSALKQAEPLATEAKRSFIATYLRTWKELNPTKYDPEIDNVESVLLESEILSLYVGIVFPIFTLHNIHVSGPQLAEEMSDANLKFSVEQKIPADNRVKQFAKEMLLRMGYE